MKYKKFKFSCQISTLHSKHVFHVTRVSRETVSIRDNYTRHTFVVPPSYLIKTCKMQSTDHDTPASRKWDADSELL